METKHSINQMADILVDWCEADLALVEAGNPTRTAREMVKCMLFTLASDGTARDLFNRLLREEIRDRNEARLELDSAI